MKHDSRALAKILGVEMTAFCIQTWQKIGISNITNSWPHLLCNSHTHTSSISSSKFVMLSHELSLVMSCFITLLTVLLRAAHDQLKLLLHFPLSLAPHASMLPQVLSYYWLATKVRRRRVGWCQVKEGSSLLGARASPSWKRLPRPATTSMRSEVTWWCHYDVITSVFSLQAFEQLVKLILRKVS